MARDTINYFLDRSGPVTTEITGAATSIEHVQTAVVERAAALSAPSAPLPASGKELTPPEKAEVGQQVGKGAETSTPKVSPRGEPPPVNNTGASRPVALDHPAPAPAGSPNPALNPPSNSPAGSTAASSAPPSASPSPAEPSSSRGFGFDPAALFGAFTGASEGDTPSSAPARRPAAALAAAGTAEGAGAKKSAGENSAQDDSDFTKKRRGSDLTAEQAPAGHEKAWYPEERDSGLAKADHRLPGARGTITASQGGAIVDAALAQPAQAGSIALTSPDISLTSQKLVDPQAGDGAVSSALKARIDHELALPKYAKLSPSEKDQLRRALERSLRGAESEEGAEELTTDPERHVARLLQKMEDARDDFAEKPAGLFRLSGAETDAEVRRLLGRDGAPVLNDIPGAQSADLFERVHSAYRRHVRRGVPRVADN